MEHKTKMPKWVLPVIIGVIISLIATIYGVTVSASIDRDTTTNVRVDKLESKIDAINDNMNGGLYEIGQRLSNIEGVLGVKSKTSKCFPSKKSSKSFRY